MTEPMIINGVDVSGCDFLAKEDLYNSYSGVSSAYKGQCGCSDDEMCKDHRNCGYKKLAKQLQRKTTECEELISTLKKLRDYELDNLDIDWDEYETDCRDADYSRELTLIQNTLDKYTKDGE